MGSRRGSLALTDNFESPTNGTPLGSRRGSLALSDNLELPSVASPTGSRRGSFVLMESSDRRSASPSQPRSDVANDGGNGSVRNKSVSSDRELMKLAVAAYENRKEEQKQAQLTAAQKMQSNLLRVLLVTSVTGAMADWSRAAKKAFLISQVDSKLTRVHTERVQLNIMFLLAIMNAACICLQCASSRVLENYRDAEVARQQVQNLLACCSSFNVTLINGKCGEDNSDARKDCVVDPGLIVSVDTDAAVAYGTSAFWTSFYLNAAVSALSTISVIALFYHAHLSKKLQIFSKKLEIKSNTGGKTGRSDDSLRLPSVYTPWFWIQICVLIVHMPPLPFDIPVLQFQHPYYAESRLLKYPWISLVSAFVTFSCHPPSLPSPTITLPWTAH
jgi:hypothetical protein